MVPFYKTLPFLDYYKNEDENATPVTISGINNVGGIIGTIVGNEEVSFKSLFLSTCSI